MSATFHEIQNEQAPKLKTPHFIVDHEFNNVGNVDKQPKLEGKNMTMILNPK